MGENFGPARERKEASTDLTASGLRQRLGRDPGDLADTDGTARNSTMRNTAENIFPSSSSLPTLLEQ
jgi:hypothetical protein